MTPRLQDTTERAVLNTAWFTFTQPWPNGTPSSQTVYSAKSRHSLATSSGHDHHKLGDTDLDIGGKFMVHHRMYSEDSTGAAHKQRHYSKVIGNPMAPGDHYHGGQWAYMDEVLPSGSPWPTFIHSSEASLFAKGATAISRCIPTNPLSGLATALGELKRDGLPSIWGASQLKNRTRIARDAGSEYLNHEFGWVPLVSDVRKFAHTHNNAEALIDQYERNSGKRVRRRYSFPIEYTKSAPQFIRNSVPRPALQAPFYSVANGDVYRVDETYRRIWFSGCFTYYLAPRGTSERSRQIANKLYGTRLTPKVLWDLTPWSWAIDWVTNLGDNIHNISAFMNDGLVMPYGYVMEESIHTHTYTHTGTRYKSYDVPHVMSQTFACKTKQRVKATPFGFGLDVGSFSSRQWAILAALGLSRSGSKVG